MRYQYNRAGARKKTFFSKVIPRAFLGGWHLIITIHIQSLTFFRSLRSSASAWDSFFLPLLRLGIWRVVLFHYSHKEKEHRLIKKRDKMKTSRATGSPFAADSCNIKLILNSKASENVQFLNFTTSCLSKPVLIRMKHFPHLAKLQVCLCKLSLSSFLLLLFHFFSECRFQKVQLPRLLCVLYLCVKKLEKMAFC